MRLQIIFYKKELMKSQYADFVRDHRHDGNFGEIYSL